jgi:hypothetical protein
MSNNFPTFSRIFIKILSILVNIVLSMTSLGLDTIHFRILTIVRLCFSIVFGRLFRLKIVSLLSFSLTLFPSQRAVAFQSGPDAKNRPALKAKAPQPIRLLHFH